MKSTFLETNSPKALLSSIQFPTCFIHGYGEEGIILQNLIIVDEKIRDNSLSLEFFAISTFSYVNKIDFSHVLLIDFNRPAAVETLDLRKADSHSAPDLAIQPEIDFVNVESLPYESESYPGLLDSIDSQDMLENGENKDCIPNNPASDLSDADLEKDLIIENVLLPNVVGPLLRQEF